MGRPFKNGVVVNSHPTGNGEYRRLRICSGPQRQMYVDIAVLEAKLGRKLLPGMTVEHINGDSLDLIGDGKIAGDNLIEVTQSENTKLMWDRTGRRKNAKKKKERSKVSDYQPDRGNQDSVRQPQSDDVRSEERP